MTIINQITSFKISGFSYTGSDTQLNYTSGIAAGIAQPSKALVLNAASNITSGINSISLNNLTTNTLTIRGTTITNNTLAALAALDGIAIGSATAGKVLIVDNSRNIININSLSATTFIGTIGTNSQPNITSLGTLTNLTSNGIVNIVQHNGSTTGLMLNNVLVTSTASELNKLSGVLTTTAELNKLNGMLTTTNELNKLSGMLTNTNELNKLNGMLTTTNELNKLNSITDGTVSANKVLVADSSRNIINLGNLTTTNNINVGNRLLLNIQLGFSHKYTTGGSSEIISYSDGIDNNYFGTSTNNDFSLAINSIRYLNIKKTTGRIGINTLNPSRQLEINASDGNCLRLIYNNNDGSGNTYADFNINSSGILSISLLGISPSFILSGGNVNISNSTASTSSTTGALILAGGMGISGVLNSSNNISTSGVIMINKTSSPNAVADFIGSNNYMINTYNRVLKCSSVNVSPVQFDILCHNGISSISTNNVIIGTSTNNDLSIMTNNSNRLNILANGYIGIGTISPTYNLDLVGNLRVSDTILFSNNTNSTSTISGALVITGGIGVGGSLFLGGSLNVSGNIIGTLQTASQPNITSTGNLTIPNSITISNSSTPITFTNTSSNSTFNCTIQNTGGSIDLGSSTNHEVYIKTNNIRQIKINNGLDILTHNGTTTGLSLNGVLVTASANELNILKGLTITATKLNYLDVTLGIADLNKVLTVDSNKDISGLNHIQNTKNTITSTNNNMLTLKNTSNSGLQNIYFDGSTSTNKWELGTRNTDVVDLKMGFYISNNTDYRFIINSVGNVGIGLLTPSSKLEVAGDINISNGSAYKINGSDISTPLSGITAGTAGASKFLMLDSNRNLININNLTVSNLYGLIATASQPNITSLGTLSGLTSSSTVFITDTTTSTTSTTGALVITGGLGISGTLTSSNSIKTTLQGNGFIHSNGTVILTSYVNDATVAGIAYLGTTSASHLGLQTNSLERIRITNSGDIGINTTSPAYKFDVNGTFRSNGISIFSNNTATTSTTSGALVITGGVGIGGSLRIGGALIATGNITGNYLTSNTGLTASGDSTFTSSTISTSSTTGALVITGGVGIGGALNVSGNITGTLSTAAQTNITSLGTLTGLTSSGSVSITNPTASTTTSSGALIVSGGVGIGNRLCVNTSIHIGTPDTNRIFSALNASTTSGTETYFTIGQSNSNRNQIEFKFYYSSNSSNSNYGSFGIHTIGQMFILSGNGNIGIYNTTPSYTLDITGTLRSTGNIYATSGSTSTSTTSGALIVTGGAGISGNVNIGGTLTVNGVQISGSGGTGDPNGYLVVTPGVASANKALVLNSSSNITNINSISANSITGIITTISQPYITSLGTLTGLTTSGDVRITNYTASTGYTSGALVVNGGVGIGGNLYTNATIYTWGISAQSGISTNTTFYSDYNDSAMAVYMGGLVNGQYWGIGGNDNESLRIGRVSNTGGTWQGSYLDLWVKRLNVFNSGYGFSHRQGLNSCEMMTWNDGTNTGIGSYSNNEFRLYAQDTWRMRLDTSGGVYRSTNSSTFNTTSDIRLKKDIISANINLCYENIKKLELVNYKWKDNDFQISVAKSLDKSLLGWIAQDVEKILPDAIIKTKNSGYDDCHSLNLDLLYSNLFGCTQKIIKDKEILENKIIELENENNKLNNKLEEILSRLDILESYVE